MQHSEVTLVYIGLAALAAVFFFALGYFIRKLHAKNKVKNAEDKAKKLLENAKDEAEKMRHGAELEAKDLLLKMRTEFEKETKDRRQELIVLEKRLIQKEENLDRKVDILDRKDKDIDRREHSLSDRERQIGSKEKELEKLFQEEKEKLQNISGMTRDEARQLL
ncbi:MAG: Rnase Y domain-containing protein, partial [Candidatus Omnitrophota bacterium]|nr:Rnase Y domain-containing protein [Candidatus Omnitrophota bacterium]